MERAPIALELGKRKRLSNGVEISVARIKKTIIHPGATALHEAAHAVVAGRIRMATIIPSGNALGSTQPETLDAASAMAGEAIGDRAGATWDRFLTKHILHEDPDSAVSRAQSRLSGKELELHLVGEALEENGTIGQSHLDDAFKRAKEIRRGIHEAKVTVIKPDGKKEEHLTKSNNNIVMFPGEWHDVQESLDKKAA